LRLHVYLTPLVAGCVASTTSTVPELTPAVELGTGEVEFVPLADGDELDIIHGPQGGYHFTVSLRVQGIDAGDPLVVADPDNPITTFHAFRDGVSVDLDASTYQQGIDPAAEPGVYEMLGRRLILDITDDAELDGAICLIDVTVTDKDGVEVHDEREILAVPSPFNE
jgi:hypothetical protein